MREIDASQIKYEISKMCMKANYVLEEDMIEAFKNSLKKEESPVGKDILKQLVENMDIAEKNNCPICQDTGVAVFFVELGQDVHIVNGSFEKAVNDGVIKGYKDGYLRKSMVDDPVFERKNTQDNTPAEIYTKIVDGDRIKITFIPKGGGSENMSEIRMMKPADGIEGVKNFVIERVKKSGGNPCNPIIVGVGIGGTFEMCALLAKKAVSRPVNIRNSDERYKKVELELIEKVNDLGLGPMGMGGRITAIAVNIETHPCHIASMPVAVNIQCHANRRTQVII